MNGDDTFGLDANDELGLGIGSDVNEEVILVIAVVITLLYSPSIQMLTYVKIGELSISDRFTSPAPIRIV